MSEVEVHQRWSDGVMSWFVTFHEPTTGAHVVLTMPEAFASGADMDHLCHYVASGLELFARGLL